MRDLEAWKIFCQRIESLGEEILKEPYPQDEHSSAEGLAHLADQVACWLGWSIGHLDTSAPFFHRSNDLVTQWGGPNQDNAYHHARIDPTRRYRIAGRMHSCESFVLTLRVGFMHMPEWGTKAMVSSRDLGIGPGDDFEILLGEVPAKDREDPERSERWTPIPPDVTTASLREYYIDWQAEEPAVFTIECLDEVPPPARATPDQVASQIDHALSQIENSIAYWNDYLREHRAAGVDNEFAERMTVAKGLSTARYSFCFWNLSPGEALVIESNPPVAQYWGLQLATLGWFEQVDPVHRLSSINQHQAVLADDGRLRVVVSATDPGVPNWLDTGGRKSGLLTFRFFWPEEEPDPTTRVLPVERVREAFPADTPLVTPADRRSEVSHRKRHLAWRFRS